MELNENMAELVGAIIGDGHIHMKGCKYRVGLTGSPVYDKEYFEYLKKIIFSELNKEVKIFIGGAGLRIVIHSKEFCKYLVEELRLSYGENKCREVTIPPKIFNNEKLTKFVIRGMFDTDGTVFAVKKPGIEKYPSIELTTISKGLALQAKEILERKGFRVSKIWQFISSGKTETYRFGLYGQCNLKKWIEDIDFSNPYKHNRAVSYLKK